MKEREEIIWSRYILYMRRSELQFSRILEVRVGFIPFTWVIHDSRASQRYPIFFHSAAANTAKLLDYHLSSELEFGIISWSVSRLMLHSRPRIARIFPGKHNMERRIDVAE